jgi:cation:H+ antiporter
MLLDFIFIFVGIAILIGGGELLVRESVKLAINFRISIIVAGSTIVAFATSAPELVVSIYAALHGTPDVSMGNVVGSNICNFGLILGLTALLRPVFIRFRAIRFDWLYMMMVSLALVVLVQDQILTSLEGFFLILALIVFVYFLVSRSRKEIQEKELTHVFPVLKKKTLLLQIVMITIAIAALYIGSHLFVDGATSVARHLNVSDRIIALTLVALGTSLPELMTSIIAVVKRETDIAVGNIIGSNIFNILSILGITSLIKHIQIDVKFLQVDLWWMLGISFLLMPLVILSDRLNRLSGLLLITIYIVYLVLLF